MKNGTVRKGAPSEKWAPGYRLVGSAGQRTFPCRNDCGFIVTVIPPTLFYHRHFCTIATVVPSPPWFHRHCGSIVIVVLWSLWFQRHCGSDHCGSIFTVEPTSLQLHLHRGCIVTVVALHCGSIVTVVPSSVWFHRHCATNVTVVPSRMTSSQ